MTKKQPPLSKRAQARRRRMRRDPFGRLGLALQAYLETKGWSVVMVGNSRVQQQPYAGKFKYEFVVEFVGSPQQTAAPPEGTMVNAGEIR